uniref:Uncharacterized protein n=1 Tax=Amazona collaria TaxID=241587 RepID=A0A8B9FKD9_9PSIT
MGLSSSKAHPKVTKVAPACAGEGLPVLTTPYWHPSMPGQPSLHPLAAGKWGNPTVHMELPPLRETWYGRVSLHSFDSPSHPPGSRGEERGGSE